MPGEVYEISQHYLSLYDKGGKFGDFYIVMLPALCWWWGVETHVVDVFFYRRHDGGIHSPHNGSIWKIWTKQIPIFANNSSRPEPSIIYAHLEEIISVYSKTVGDSCKILLLLAESFFLFCIFGRFFNFSTQIGMLFIFVFRVKTNCKPSFYRITSQWAQNF